MLFIQIRKIKFYWIISGVCKTISHVARRLGHARYLWCFAQYCKSWRAHCRWQTENFISSQKGEMKIKNINSDKFIEFFLIINKFSGFHKSISASSSIDPCRLSTYWPTSFDWWYNGHVQLCFDWNRARNEGNIWFHLSWSCEPFFSKQINLIVTIKR